MKRALHPLGADPTRAFYDRDVRAWVAPFPMSIIDSPVVRRSCSLTGIDLAYQEFIIFNGALAPVWAVAATVGTSLFYKALRSPFLRNLAQKTMQAGEGPPRRAWTTAFSGAAFGAAQIGETAEVRFSGKGDPANRIAVLCVCESALAIACDSGKLPNCAGVLTPSVGIGEALVHRLRNRASQSPSAPFINTRHVEQRTIS